MYYCKRNRSIQELLFKTFLYENLDLLLFDRDTPNRNITRIFNDRRMDIVRKRRAEKKAFLEKKAAGKPDLN